MMGISYRTYVGPYAVCKVEIVDKPHYKRVCINQTCKRYHEQSAGRGGQYCSHCGTLTADVNFPEREPAIDSWHVAEQIFERLTTPGGDAYFLEVRKTGRELWMPNVQIEGMERDPHLEEREDFYEVAIKSPAQEVLAFETTFVFELDFLRITYGHNNVYVTWGIIQDYL